MNQSAFLCLALAGLTYCASAVVYGKLTVSQKDACFVYGFHSNENSYKYENIKKGGAFKSIKDFLQASQIALEISYTKSGPQFQANLDSLGTPVMEESKSQVLATIVDTTETHSLPELKPEPIILKPMPIIQNELSRSSEEVVALESSERPSLRMPAGNQ